MAQLQERIEPVVPMDTSTTDKTERMNTASSSSNTAVTKANTGLYIVLYRAKSASIKDKLKKLLTFCKKKPIYFIKIVATLTEAEVRDFWKGYIRDVEKCEQYEVETCFADGTPVKKWNDDTGLFDQVAKGVRIVDKEKKHVKDVWMQRVRYVNGM